MVTRPCPMADPKLVGRVFAAEPEEWRAIFESSDNTAPARSAHHETDRSDPRELNFAVNGKYAQELLERSEVPYQTATTDVTLSTAAIAERALKLTVLVQCFR